MVNVGRVITILNLRSGNETGISATEVVRQLLASRSLMDLAGEQAKSLVLTETELILSPISSTTLKKRAEKHRFWLTGLPS